MKLNWKKLFEMQAALDRHIIEDKDLEGQDLLDKKILALLVELGELANELPEVFKFWSGKKKNNYEKALAEYIDGLHFILSIGLDLEVGDMWDVLDIKPTVDVTGGIIGHFDKIFRFTDQDMDAYEWLEVTEYFLGLGSLLGFNADQVTQAYLDKNEINHQRQNSNY